MRHAFLGLLLASGTALAQPLPALHFEPPKGFTGSLGGPPGSGSWQIATRFYLLSRDGRFHRGYGLPSVPGGDVRTFDYAKAEREDAPNSGTYTVKGNRLLLRTRSGESVEGSLARGELKIENLIFKKAGLK